MLYAFTLYVVFTLSKEHVLLPKQCSVCLLYAAAQDVMELHLLQNFPKSTFEAQIFHIDCFFQTESKNPNRCSV